MNLNGVGQIWTAYTPQHLGGALEASPRGETSVKDAFLAWAKMTTSERMRANILSSMGLTEDELAAMPAWERGKVETRIKEMVAAKVRAAAERGETGLVLDRTV